MVDKKKEIRKDVPNNWRKEKELGAGGFGAVQLWKNTSNDDTIAIKLISCRNVKGKELSKLKQRWEDEFKMMNTLKCDYIVKGVKLKDPNFVKSMNDKFSHSGEYPVIFMEYCNAGDLRSLLREQENVNGLPECEVKEIIKSLRHAIEYLHKWKIEHRDLKPENILINEKDGKRSYKLTDFGLARKNETDKTLMQSLVGTKLYFAPEVLEGVYSKSVDYWSFGIITFEIICGVLPFIPHQSIPTTIKNILKKPRSCIAITENPTTKEVIQHDRLFPQNRLSKVFEDQIAAWLQLSLDSDRKTRGLNINNNNMENKVIIYQEIDRILSKKILTVFCINNLRYYYYDLDLCDTWEKLQKAFLIDFRKSPELIHPLFHPINKLDPSHVLQPMDLYNSEWKDYWRDTSEPKQHPPAMLYAIIHNRDEKTFQFEYRNDKLFSPTMENCFTIDLDKVESLPYWYIQEFAVHVHHLLSDENRRLKGLVCGLRDYAFKYEEQLNIHARQSEELLDKCMEVSAKFELYVRMVPLSEGELKEINKKIEFLRLTRYKIKERQRSAMRIIGEELDANIYKSKLKEDIFGLTTFRLRINEYLNSDEQDKRKLFERAKEAVIFCTKTRSELYSKEMVKHMNNIMSAVHMYNIISELTTIVKSELIQHEMKLQSESQRYMTRILQYRNDNKIVPAASTSSLIEILERMEQAMQESLTPTTIRDLLNE